MKIVAFAIIIMSFTAFGFSVAFSYKARITFFEKLITTLDVISSEFKFGKAPLSKLLSNINKNKVISAIGYFEDVENYLNEKLSPSEAFVKSNAKAIQKFSLKTEDNDILQQIPEIFSCENSSTALIMINKLTHTTENLVKDLNDKYKTKAKLSKGLGLLSGVFVVIIFL